MLNRDYPNTKPMYVCLYPILPFTSKGAVVYGYLIIHLKNEH